MELDAVPLPDDAHWHDDFLAAETGDGAAAGRLFSAFYAELKQLARRELQRHEGHTLGATTLLHEAYVNLAQREALTALEPARFMSYAAKAMRGLTIDLLRERRALKRGGAFEFTALDTTVVGSAVEAWDLHALEDALAALAGIDAGLAELVDLHFFGGLSFIEIAALRKVSARTVQRDWQKARLLLHRELAAEADAPAEPPRAWPA